MPAKKTFLLRLDPRVWEAVQAMAADELRSVNGQIEYVLRQAIERSGRKLPLPSATTDDDS